MKKLLFASLFFTTFLIAQNEEKKYSTVEKGTWSAGGQMAFTFFENEQDINNSVSDTRFTGFTINPNVSYAINENLFLGLTLGYNYQKNKYVNSQSDISESNSFSLGTYIKKYIPITKNFTFNIQGELNYIKTNSSLDNIDDVNSNAFQIGFRPGLTLFLSKNIALETQIGILSYTHSKFERPDYNSQNISYEGTSNTFNFNLNSSNLLFGLTYFFR